jgi:TRAP-type C4-dicarboxylate transport system permease large subunit
MMGFILALGFFVDVMVMIIMFAQPFAEVAARLGYDPIHFGVVFTLAATIGGITPPVGSLLFVACSIGRIGLAEASRAIWPFVLALVLVTAVLILFPSMSTVVPRLVFQ